MYLAYFKYIWGAQKSPAKKNTKSIMSQKLRIAHKKSFMQKTSAR